MCMHILKALDQGEVDIRKNKELKSHIYKAAKRDAINRKIALKNNLQSNENTMGKISPKGIVESDDQSHHSIIQSSLVG